MCPFPCSHSLRWDSTVRQIPLPTRLAVLGLVHSTVWLALWLHTAVSDTTSYQPESLDWLLQDCSPAAHPQSVPTFRATVFQVQNLALTPIKLRVVGDCPTLSFIKASLPYRESAIYNLLFSTSLVVHIEVVYSSH